jgi:XRE family transcriptional regulator of biofilm formation
LDKPGDKMIGSYIKQLRTGKGMSLSELAERAGVAKSYISSIERGIQLNPSIQTLDKISRVIDIPIEQLLNPSVPSLDVSELDREWLELAKQFASSGISKDEFREFLEFQKWRKKDMTNKPVE